jgi:hypothetical protein
MSTPQDDKPDNSSEIMHVGQDRDDKAKQESRSEEYEQEIKKLLNLHRPDKIPALTLFLKILSLYLLFVTAVVAFGALAFSSGHITTFKLTFIASIVLLLLLPIGAIWYWGAGFRKKSAEKAAIAKQRLLDKFAQSFFGRALLFLGNSRIYRLFSYAFCVYAVVDTIINTFPRRPRFALGIITIFTALFLTLVILEVARQLDSTLRKETKEIWEFNELLRKAVVSLADSAIATMKNLDQFIELQAKTNDSILDVIVKVNDTTRALAGITDEQLDTPTVKDDKEPNDH